MRKVTIQEDRPIFGRGVDREGTPAGGVDSQNARAGDPQGQACEGHQREDSRWRDQISERSHCVT
eukprot:2095625-Pyramimonas_sp.AAC.1